MPPRLFVEEASLYGCILLILLPLEPGQDAHFLHELLYELNTSLYLDAKSCYYRNNDVHSLLLLVGSSSESLSLQISQFHRRH